MEHLRADFALADPRLVEEFLVRLAELAAKMIDFLTEPVGVFSPVLEAGLEATERMEVMGPIPAIRGRMGRLTLFQADDRFAQSPDVCDFGCAQRQVGIPLSKSRQTAQLHPPKIRQSQDSTQTPPLHVSPGIVSPQ
jgi:hypothetical protein